MTYEEIAKLLDHEAKYLLTHRCENLPKDLIYQVNPNQVREIFSQSDRSQSVIENLEKIYGHGRLANTGYLSILPVDQDIEHTASFSFYKNPLYFDPENIIRLALEAESNAIASSLGALALLSKKYADRIPFIVKINHNELLTYPNKWDQTLFAQVKQAYELGAVAIGATIYFGSPESNRQIREVSAAFYQAHQLGMATILWCYPRNSAWETKDADYNSSADITAQANRLGVTIEADIIKQKMPTIDGAFRHFKFAKYSDQMYETLSTENPIDMLRLQVINCYAGKIPLLNSGGESAPEADFTKDLKAAVRSAVINKRAGGAGLILGRKAFKRPMEEGVKLLRAVQDVYLEEQITIA
ncbi:class I fructose-bisphosphate aldolase [Candidatus Woesebacteria bacterium]|jgi:class I fructose-bisphosphate aldolase|nr:class I fructose-bisphosphate aldolase [Candidatus Woesebacteria bacterium]HOC07520.1 class I fructose-bisphosphate aldolase [Candidatus Woesebacteria bacterium]